MWSGNLSIRILRRIVVSVFVRVEIICNVYFLGCCERTEGIEEVMPLWLHLYYKFMEEEINVLPTAGVGWRWRSVINNAHITLISSWASKYLLLLLIKKWSLAKISILLIKLRSLINKLQFSIIIIVWVFVKLLTEWLYKSRNFKCEIHFIIMGFFDYLIDRFAVVLSLKVCERSTELENVIEVVKFFHLLTFTKQHKILILVRFVWASWLVAFHFNYSQIGLTFYQSFRYVCSRLVILTKIYR